MITQGEERECRLSTDTVHEAGLDELVPIRVEDPLLPSFAGLKGKIVLFGGSFDPVHQGHLHMAEEVRKAVEADRIVFLPAQQNPHKEHSTIASGSDRVEMIRRALIGREGLYVSPHEIRRSETSPSYAIDTLREVRNLIDADASLFFLIGSDNINALHKWRDVEGIFKLVDGVITVPRPEENRHLLSKEEISRLNPSLTGEMVEVLERYFVPLPGLKVSSTSIRSELAAGGELRDLPPEVADYIKEKALYPPR